VVKGDGCSALRTVEGQPIRIGPSTEAIVNYESSE
jgi:hypothetical protein